MKCLSRYLLSTANGFFLADVKTSDNIQHPPANKTVRSSILICVFGSVADPDLVFLGHLDPQTDPCKFILLAIFDII